MGSPFQSPRGGIWRAGVRLETHDEVEATLQSALEYDRPSVVDAHINPAEDVYPIVPSSGDNAKFAMNEAQLEEL